MKQASGFSLIEMAFVLVIITLLLGGLLVPFTTQVEQRRITETNKAMEEVKEALLGFAIANGRLPCPDATGDAVAPNINNDGLEDRTGGVCNATQLEGNLPWVTLGVGAADAWGNHLRYRVTQAFTDTGTFTLNAAGTLRVCTTAACAATLATQVPAVVVSHGRNGLGAINVNRAAGDSTRIPCPGAPPTCSADENVNLVATNNDFVSRILTAATTPAGEFDDTVAWLSTNILFNRMVSAGKLP